MSALTLATVIVEAGEHSGTRIQARAALQQNRKLLIMENLARRKDLSWPATMLKKGAHCIKKIEDVLDYVK